MFALPPDLRMESGVVSDIGFRIAVFSFSAMTILLTAFALFMH
jgi:hypothetical protein